MSLSQKYEKMSRRFSFVAPHHFKVELCCYVHIILFGKHMSELY